MSKIGNVNLELQEEANRLGFSTVQEALDNGYEVRQFTEGIGDLECDDIVERLVKIDSEVEAHEAWLEKKRALIKKLVDARDDLASYALGVNEKNTEAATIAVIIAGAIKVIEEVKYEQ